MNGNTIIYIMLALAILAVLWAFYKSSKDAAEYRRQEKEKLEKEEWDAEVRRTNEIMKKDKEYCQRAIDEKIEACASCVHLRHWGPAGQYCCVLNPPALVRQSEFMQNAEYDYPRVRLRDTCSHHKFRDDPEPGYV